MLYLASKSPRRRELLGHLGVAFEVIDVDVPEQRARDESPIDYVRRVAADKARAGLALVAADADAIVLGADTEVVLDDEVFGKPRDVEDAGAMLRRLSGRTHAAISALTLLSATRAEHALSVSEVTFDTLDEAVIARYLAGGDWAGKAGAYAIQGAAQAFIAHLSGSQSGVMGLPLYETARRLREFEAVQLPASVPSLQPFPSGGGEGAECEPQARTAFASVDDARQ